MDKRPNLKAVQTRIKQVEIELERLRMLERLALMQQGDASTEQPSIRREVSAGAAAR